MEKLNAPMLTGLRFNQRDSNFERLLNITLAGKRDTLTTRRAHNYRFTVPYMPTELIYHNGGIYTLAVDGALRHDLNVLDTGYNPNGSFHVTVPSLQYNVPHLFVAADKMRKINLTNSVVTNWGITPPTNALANPVTFVPSVLMINSCDSTTGWSVLGTGFAVGLDGTIKTEGANSIAVTIPANTDGLAQFFSAAPIDLSDSTPDDYLYFNLLFSNPTAIEYFSISIQNSPGSSASISNFDLGMKGSAKGLPGESQYSSGAFAWNEIHISRQAFVGNQGNWGTFDSITFRVKSTVAQIMYVDNIRMLQTASNASFGNRWAYRYENSLTKHSSNLSPATELTESHRLDTVLTGFVASTDAQVDIQRVFRDSNGDGNFRSVGTKPNDTNNYTDSTADRDLGDADLNDNATPVAATLVAFAHERLWINDNAVPDRLWRSAPGRYEAMSEFFSVGTQDPITFISIIAGQFTVLTTNQIIRVLGADSDTPTFVPLADIGGILPTAATLRGDSADILHHTGLYNFNGSTITPLPHINTLFDQSSVDTRRLNWSNIHTVSLGSSDLQTWLTYQSLFGEYRTYVFDSVSNEWFEESDILWAHDTAHLLINHIASDRFGNVWDVYGDQGAFTNGIHIPRLLDITKLEKQSLFADVSRSISRIVGFSVEYMSLADNYIILSVDETQIGPVVTIPAWPYRRWFHVGLDGMGKRLAWQLTINNTYTELYAASWDIVEMPSDGVSFDTGDICLSDQLLTPVQIVVQMYAHEPLRWHGSLWLDGQTNEGDFHVASTGIGFPQRFNLRPYAGRTVRFRIDSTGPFSLISAVIGVINYGDGSFKSMALHPKAN